ncbi:MAG TPA: ATP-binding protein, partial [Bacteroidales bacterium]|nr:ATP-binding protein [Bacteroidales bacterium]
MNDLALHLLDIVQNSLSAGASLITITVDEDLIKNKLSMAVKDNGRGMTKEQVKKLSDPFFTSRTTRRVGLG